LAGKPINVGSGNMRYEESLFSIAENTSPVSFVLTYNSRNTASGPLGPGFTHSFAQTMKPLGGSTFRAEWINEKGERTIFYSPDSASVPFSAVWPAEATGTVTLNSVAGTYELKDLDGNVTTFWSASGEWRSTQDRWGNTISGGYTGSDLTSLTDPEGRVWSLAYTAGKLSSITAPDSRVWSFTYNATGHLEKVVDPFHTVGAPWRTYTHVTGYASDPLVLASVADGSGAILEGHEYDAAGRAISSWSGATSVVDGVPHPTSDSRDLVTLVYDSATQTTVTNKIDATTNSASTFTLTARGGRFLPLSIVGNCPSCGAAEDSSVYTYDDFNHLSTAVVGIGADQVQTNWTYDSNGMVLTRVRAFGKPEQQTTTYAYGKADWPAFATSITEASAAKPGQTKVTTHTWNVGETMLASSTSGYLLSTDASPTTYTTTTLFDSRHRQTEMTGPNTNQKVTHTYYPDDDATVNRRGRLQTSSTYTSATAFLQTQFDNYDLYGTALSVVDPNGVETQRTTDAVGRVLAVVSKKPAGDAAEPADYTTTYTFDLRDRLTDVTLPRDNRLRYVYEDGTNRLTDTVRVDSAALERERLHLTLNTIGGKTQEEAQRCETSAPSCGSWTTRRSESFSYDPHNRLSSVLHPDSTRIDYAYDTRGNLTGVKDERHTSSNTLYTYDALNRLKQVTQKQTLLPGPDVLTLYDYDVADNLVSVTDPNGNVTSYAYDDFGRMQKQTSPVSGLTMYSYDPAGNLASSTDANSATTTRTYDAANRILTSTSARTGFPTEAVTWTYDDATAGAYGKGRLATMTDPSGSTAYAYERRGLPRAESRTIQGDAYSISYGYDANGNRSRVTYPSGRVVDYTFDFADRPFSASSGATSYVVSAAYEPFGPESGLTYGTTPTMTRTMTYDQRYRPVELKLQGSNTIYDYFYNEDAVGNVTSICATSGICTTPTGWPSAGTSSTAPR
jgi:YD repeat-containing protein